MYIKNPVLIVEVKKKYFVPHTRTHPKSESQ